MSKHVQLYRLAAGPAAAYVGPAGEVVVTTGDWTARVHDGVTPGGVLLLNKAVADALYPSFAYVAAAIAGFATLTGAEELTNKTLTAAVAKGVWTASGPWTIPAVTIAGAITYGGVTLANAVTGTGKMVLDTAPSFSGNIIVIGRGLFGAGLATVWSVTNVNVAPGGTLDLDLLTSGNSFVGTCNVSSIRLSDANFNTSASFAVAGRGSALSQATLVTGSGSGTNTFTLTMVSNGVLRITNTSGNPSLVTLSFFGHIS